MKRTMIGVGFALGLALLGASQAQAQPVIDFGLNSPGTGTISYTTAGGPLVGTLIPVNQINGVSTPLNAGSGVPPGLSVTGGDLEFTTGNYTGGGTTSWNFGAGGANSITIKGAADGLPAGTTLLSGMIESATMTSTGVTIAVFINTVNATIASYFGLSGGPSNLYTGTLNLSVTTTLPTPGQSSTFTATSGSGDVRTTPVPEPSTMAFVGLGALGMIGYGLRRRKASGA